MSLKFTIVMVVRLMINVKVLRNDLFKTLKRIYNGDGLYCEISSINFNYDSVEDYNDPFIEISVRYGRATDDGKNNFGRQFTIYTGLKELVKERQFFLGRCYEKFDEEFS